MEDLNVVNQTGRLTRDAELKYTSGGIPVCKFAIAVNKRKKIANQWTEYVSFFDCVLWGALGEAINRYMVKGKHIVVEGELHQNRWEQEGQTRSKVEILIKNVHFLPGGKNTQDRQNYDNMSPQAEEQYLQGPLDVEYDVTF